MKTTPLLFLLLFVVCISNEKQPGNITKSQYDQNLYKAIRLDNDMTCLMVQNKFIDRSVIAFSLFGGGLQDPKSAQGLTHLTLRSIISQSHNYPNEGESQNYVYMSQDAFDYVLNEDLFNIYFEIPANQFYDAQKLFSKFLIGPLFSNNTIKYQLQIINERYNRLLTDDDARFQFFIKSLAKENNPYRNLVYGNSKTLNSPNLLQLVKKQYENKLSSNLVRLVVFTNQQFSYIESVIRSIYSKVPNKKVKKPEYQRRGSQVFAEGAFQKLYTIKSVDKNNVLSVLWILTEQSKNYENPPAAYLDYFAESQLQGSLAAFLIKQQLIQGLITLSGDTFPLFHRFQFIFQLTTKGLQNISKIVSYTLYFLQTMKKAEPVQQVFASIQRRRNRQFKFNDRTAELDQIVELASRMQRFKVEDVVVYPYLMKEWKPHLIKEYLAQFTEKNYFVTLQSNNDSKQFTQRLEYLEIKYNMADLRKLKSESFSYKLQAKKNPFEPSNLSVYPLVSKESPTLYKLTKLTEQEESQQFHIFTKRDHKYGLPKMIIKCKLLYLGNNTAKQVSVRELFVQLFIQRVRGLLYEARSAGIQLSLLRGSCWITVSVSGFRDGVLKIVKPFFEQLFVFDPSEVKQRFEIIKNKHKKSIENQIIKQPKSVAQNQLFQYILSGVGFNFQQILRQLQLVKFDDIVNFSKSWKKKLFTEIFITGNILSQQIDNAVNLIKQQVKKYSQALSKTNKHSLIKNCKNTKLIYTNNQKKDLISNLIFIGIFSMQNHIVFSQFVAIVDQKFVNVKNEIIFLRKSNHLLILLLKFRTSWNIWNLYLLPKLYKLFIVDFNLSKQGNKLIFYEIS